jgi:hypothetical protein
VCRQSRKEFIPRQKFAIRVLFTKRALTEAVGVSPAANKSTVYVDSRNISEFNVPECQLINDCQPRLALTPATSTSSDELLGGPPTAARPQVLVITYLRQWCARRWRSSKQVSENCMSPIGPRVRAIGNDRKSTKTRQRARQKKPPILAFDARAVQALIDYGRLPRLAMLRGTYGCRAQRADPPVRRPPEDWSH